MSNNIEVINVRTNEIEKNTLEEISLVFDQCYRQPNLQYLVDSFNTFRWIALGRDNGELVGFAAGDSRQLKLPRLDGTQGVMMAGIACVLDEYRQGGLFRQLAFSSILASGEIDLASPFLFCGRMAHAVSYQTMARNANNAVPRYRQPISAWHREVMQALAKVFGVTVDADTGRVIGKGEPIGYPLLDYKNTTEEAALFEPIDRDKGDSLLAMSWMPEAPVGWLEVDEQVE